MGCIKADPVIIRVLLHPLRVVTIPGTSDTSEQLAAG